MDRKPRAECWYKARFLGLEKEEGSEFRKRNRKGVLVRAAKSRRLREEDISGEVVWSTLLKKMRMENMPLAWERSLLRPGLKGVMMKAIFKGK